MAGENRRPPVRHASYGGVVVVGFGHRIEAEGVLYRLIEHGDTLRVRLWQLPYGDQGIFVPRGAFRQLGGFSEVRLMEDILLMRRRRKLLRIRLLPGPLYTRTRGWRKHGVVRQTLRNRGLLTAEKPGVSPDGLAERHAPHVSPASFDESG